jgi:hypothetical protein
MIIMPHNRPGHRSSSQARQTSGTPQASPEPGDGPLSVVSAPAVCIQKANAPRTRHGPRAMLLPILAAEHAADLRTPEPRANGRGMRCVTTSKSLTECILAITDSEREAGHIHGRSTAQASGGTRSDDRSRSRCLARTD